MYADVVRDALERAQLPAEAVTLELTESILFSDAPHVRDALTNLHGIGLRLAIEDFGTGYSSLSYLSKFPVDLIKIDRSFVAGLDQTGRNTTHRLRDHRTRARPRPHRRGRGRRNRSRTR